VTGVQTCALPIWNIDNALKKLPQEIIDRRAETLSPRELAKLADILAYERI
jgi:hypothetical protein